MGNIAIYPANGLGVPANIVPYVFQGANPEIMQAEVQALIDDMIAATIPGGLFDIAIAGAGDGHSFVVTVFVDSDGGSPASGTTAAIYMGASREAVTTAQNLALAALTEAGATLVAHGIAGASQGLRFMGIMLGFPAE